MEQWFQEAIANPWLERYILIGYAAKGTVYLSIGILALQAAISEHEAAGTYSTLTWLTDRPLGKVLVCLLAIALIGYVLRRLFQTILLPGYSNPWSIKCLGKRIGYIMSGLSYAGVAYSALNIVLELGEADDTIEDLASELFEQQIGEWLILLGGIGVTTVGLFYIYGAYSGSYISELESDELHHRLEKWTIRIGKLGVAARGLAFVLMGVFLIQATISGNSELAGGLENTLRLISTKPLGWLWLGSIGVGMICYGVYMFVAAVYRRYAIR